MKAARRRKYLWWKNWTSGRSRREGKVIGRMTPEEIANQKLLLEYYKQQQELKQKRKAEKKKKKTKSRK